MKDLEGWILQMDDYFSITQTQNDIQRLTCIGLCTQGDMLVWWKSNKYRFNTREEVKNTIRKYCSEHYKPDGAFNGISDDKQIGTVYQ